MHTEDYIYRIGRTGRAQPIWKAFTHVTRDEAGMIHRIEYILKQKIEQHKVDGLDYSAPITHTPNAERSHYVEANRRKPNTARRSSRRRGQNRRKANVTSRDVF